MRIPFGKYKGESLAALDDDYLEWLLSIDLRPQLRAAVEGEVAARRNPAVPDPLLARQIVNAGFKRLAQDLHPDHGGDIRTMQALNNTAAWLRRQTEALVGGCR